MSSQLNFFLIVQNGIYGFILFLKFVILKFSLIHIFFFPAIFSWIKILYNNRNCNHGCQFQHNRITIATTVFRNITTETITTTAVFIYGFSENPQPIHHYSACRSLWNRAYLCVIRKWLSLWIGISIVDIFSHLETV